MKNETAKGFVKGLCIGTVLVVILYVVLTLLTSIRIEVKEEQYVSIGEQYSTEESFNATWFGVDVTKWVEISGLEEIDTQQEGNFELNYFIKFFPYVNAQSIVYVKDLTAPVIVLMGSQEMELDYIDDYEEPGYFVVDNVDKDLNDKVNITIEKEEVSDNMFNVIYTVKDTAGNEGEVIRKLYVHNYVGVVYLTFDDGPSYLTPQFLDVLDEKGVNATFFVIGNEISGREDILVREYESGNTIGLHGYSHVYEEIYTDIDSLMNNFYRVQQYVEEITGQVSKILRFPGGTSNTVSRNYCNGIMTLAVDRVTTEGFVYYDWNIDSNDAGSSVNSSEEIYQNVISAIQPGRENVVLMHDASNHEATLEALPRIIDWLKENNYSIKPITTTTTPVQHGALN